MIQGGNSQDTVRIQGGYSQDTVRIQVGYREDTVRIQWCGGGDGICDNQILLDRIFASSDMFKLVKMKLMSFLYIALQVPLFTCLHYWACLDIKFLSIAHAQQQFQSSDGGMVKKSDAIYIHVQ